jgi:uncharacterized protein (TIGR00288 family)
VTTIDFAPNLCIFCDFENVAIGAKDADYGAFEIAPVLERLLDKGKIVVKKAYADWDRYKTARKPLHEAGFELIEIPHVSYSGKNSADIRMVVDALDLCYTKSHVDVFVIVSGDSDFSPLVGKLRENNKTVIGLGVKNSTSDLFIDNCDEFIYYDDLVGQRTTAAKRLRRKAKDTKASPARPAQGEEPAVNGGDDARQRTGLDLVMDTVDALFRERGDNLWGSMVKQTLKRKKPNFNEAFHGYRNFNHLLEDAHRRGLLEIEKDERSGGYRIVSFGPSA